MDMTIFHSPYRGDYNLFFTLKAVSHPFLPLEMKEKMAQNTGTIETRSGAYPFKEERTMSGI